MLEFDVVYIDDTGDKQDYTIAAPDVRVAIQNTFELCPDARRILRCVRTPMFTD